MTIQRRDFLRISGMAAVALGTFGCGPRDTSESSEGVVAAAWSGYDDALVVDALAGPVQFNIPQGARPLSDAALEYVRASGITAVNLTVSARPSGSESAYEATVAKIAGWVREAEAHPDVLSVVRSVEEIRAVKGRGGLGLIFGFQDTVPFDEDLGRLDDFYADGLRIIQLTYNAENRIGVGCLSPNDTGLTDLGIEAVARMDELGILVDLSHCGAQTTIDGIQASTGPVSITHSGCNAVYRHPRSKDDDTMRLLADRGGVFGVYLMPFLNASGPPTAEDVLTHLEHALDVCGEDHVGIGSDQGIMPLDVSGDFPAAFDAVSAQRSAAGIAAPREDTIPYVPDLNHPRRLETIGEMMSARGHTAAVIDKVLGQNFTRLFAEVWT